MAYYDWSKITEKYTENELRKVVRDFRMQPPDKITAALNELKTRGIELTNPLKMYDVKAPIVINDLSVCYHCKSKGLKETDIYCPVCAFPQRGTQFEMNNFLYLVCRKEQLLEEHQSSVNKARYILYSLAALDLVYGLIDGLLIEKKMIVVIAGLIGGLIYFLFGLWSRKQALPAILTGLIVYVFFNVISAFADPTSIYKGFIWKILIIASFIYGYLGARDSKKLELELKSTGISKDLSAE